MASTKKEYLLKLFAEVARLILGVTFTFSGFVKSVDPYGTAYKVVDYLEAFNLSFFSFLGMPISFFLCGFEFVLGVLILLGIYCKWSSLLVLLTMCFMTPLTLYLAIANPVSDCGCFGDALVFTNWETFYKNIVLLSCAIFLVFYYRLITPLFSKKVRACALLYIILFGGMFLLYNYYYDPILDFRPYRIGANLPEQMVVDESKMPVEENVFIYKKNGEEKQFTEDNYPWQDSTWVFVSMRTNVIKEGELPVISDFTVGELVFNENLTEIDDQHDITDDVLQNTNYSFLIIAPSLVDINPEQEAKFKTVTEYSEKNGYDIYCLTSSSTDLIIESKKKYPCNLKFCISDEKVLKTIIRSNPGLVVLKAGTVVSKWAAPSISDANYFAGSLDLLTSKADDRSNTSKALPAILILVIPLLILKGLDMAKYGKRR